MTREEIQGLRAAIILVAPDLVMMDLSKLFDWTLTLMDEVNRLEAALQSAKEELVESKYDRERFHATLEEETQG